MNNLIQKFASDACTVISACQEMIAELSAENNKLKAEAEAGKIAKTASAKPVFDAAALNKAAAAVHAIYGSPENISVQTIANAWQSKPELMLNVINKFASELTAKTQVSGAKLGQPIAKTASAKETKLTADELLREKYSF